MASEIQCEPEILRDYLTELLQGKADLDGCEILSRRVADLQNEIMRSLDKNGLSVVVMIPELTCKEVQSGTVYFDPANIVVRVVENVLFNRKKTGKSAFYIATRVAAILKMHEPPFEWCREIAVKKLRQLNIISGKPDDEDEEDLDGWDVLASTKLTIQPRSSTN